MKKENKNIIKLMNNQLYLKEYLLNNAVIETTNNRGVLPTQSFEITSHDLNFKIVEYMTTAKLELCLSFFFEHLTASEISQIVSMFTFHYELFNETLPKNDVISIMSTDANITVSSKIIDIFITKGTINIQQESSFFKKNYSFKNKILNFSEFQKIMIKQIKVSVSKYFEKTIKNINVNTINNILIETIDDYNERLNQKHYFKNYIDYDFFVNIKNSNIPYKTIMVKDYVNQDIQPENELCDDYDLIILKHNPEKNNEKVLDRISVYDQITLYMNINNTKTLKILLTPIFQDKDLSYLLSIISLFHFSRQIHYPFDKKITLSIYKEPKKKFEKETVYTHEHTFHFRCNEFALSVGRNVELYICDFFYKDNNLMAVYQKLLTNITHNISISAEIDPKELTYRHVQLEQMKNV